MLTASKGYSREKLHRDVMAGMTVAAVAAPQAMAYALIAGVPVEYGIYTIIIQCFIGSLFNSQPLLSVGPTNTQSLLVASTVTFVLRHQEHLPTAEYDQIYLQLVVALSLLKGVMQLAMAVARLGGLVRYVSQSVIVGFSAGAGLLIAAGQVHWLLGFEATRTGEDWPGLIGDIQRVVRHVDEISLRSVLVGVACMAIMIIARRFSKLAPGPLIAVVAAGCATAALGWSNHELPMVTPLPDASDMLSIFRLPWELTEAPDLAADVGLQSLLGGAMALSLLGLIEAYSIGKTIAAKTGDRVNANQELFSQGLTNAASSFFQCIPGSGSFSRSALNQYAGAATSYAGLINAVVVALVFLLLAPWAKLVPMAALAAILVVVAYGLIDFHYFRRVFRSNRADSLVCVSTLLATLFLPLAYAVFVGIFLNIALFLRRASQLHMAEMVRTRSGPYEERPMSEGTGNRRVMLVQLEGDLFFGVADELEQQLNSLVQSSVRVVVFRLKRTMMMDTTVLCVLERFVRLMRRQHRHVMFCGVKPELYDTMNKFGLVRAVDEANVFQTTYGVFASAQQAMDRARELLAGSIDVEEWDRDGMDGWTYVI